MSIKITHVRVIFNGHRMAYKESIEVQDKAALEVLRLLLKDKYKAKYIDMNYYEK